MTFKEIYNPPFNVIHDGLYVLSGSGVKTFTAFSPDAQEHAARIVKILNGDSNVEKYSKNNIIYQGTKLCICGSMVLVRGWGMLVGVGGYHLPREEAARIQDDFIKWLIDTITI